ncbi:MAG: hypothetical protein GY867_08205 [bacterium]|nr:hypothetical protein [bacterium]
MITATRILYMVSGIIILVTGLYVESAYAGHLSEATRLLVGVAAVTYFFIQLNRQLRRPVRQAAAEARETSRRQFSS